MQTETATSAWGCILLRCAETTRQLVAVVRQFAQANFAVVLRFTKVKSFRKSMQTETATSAWGCILLRCAKRRGNFIFI